MICYMHEGNPYGYMKVGDKVILPDNLARMCGLTASEVEGYLSELKEANVYEVDEFGAIFSRRMIRDENLRMARAAGGKLGGNPKLKVGDKVNLKVEKEVNQKTTPSSSSSSSSSKDIYTPEFEQFWSAYPEKTGKGEAFKSWKKTKPNAQLQSAMLSAIVAYKLSKKVKEGFVKNPATWLNQRCWEDEFDKEEAPSPFAGDI
jgi:hypothetical protein